MAREIELLPFRFSEMDSGPLSPPAAQTIYKKDICRRARTWCTRVCARCRSVVRERSSSAGTLSRFFRDECDQILFDLLCGLVLS